MIPCNVGSKEHIRVAAEYSAAIINAMLRILGDELFSQVMSCRDRLLVPGSVLDRSGAAKHGMPLGKSGFFTAMRSYADPSDKFPPGAMTRMRLAPGFYFAKGDIMSQREMYESWIDPILADYVHYCCHFTLFSVQPAPMHIAEQLLRDRLQYTGPEYPALTLEGAIRTIESCKLPPDEKRMFAQLFAWFVTLTYKRLCEIDRLCYEVFTELGLKPPEKPYLFGEPSLLIAKFGDKVGAVVIPVGDPLMARSVRERYLMARDWLENFRPQPGFQQAFQDWLRKLTFEKVPFPEILKEQ